MNLVLVAALLLAGLVISQGSSRWRHLDSASSETDDDLIIQQLPKFELHAHLHGSIRYSTLLDFIRVEIEHERYNLDSNSSSSSVELHQWLETEQQVLQRLTVQAQDTGNADKPFEVFAVIHRIIKHRDQVRRILLEMLEDYEQEQTLYLELRSTPRGLPDGTTSDEYLELLASTIQEHNAEVLRNYQLWSRDSQRLSNYSQAIDAQAQALPFLSQLQRSEHKHMLVKLIVSVDRSRKSTEAINVLDLAMKINNGRVGDNKVVVGLDFSGNPLGGRFEDFAVVFERARNQLFNITVHVAEAPELSEENDNKVDETTFILNFRYVVKWTV
jgi:adenosine deaminase